MLSSLLLAWYDAHGRKLPFRGTKDPYRIWVSEIMLQQTRTETVGAYYERFLLHFPDVFALAKAPEQEVLKCWEGLGYYSRARNIHKTAKIIAEEKNGVFPRTVQELLSLPGIGEYTAAAIASIAFDCPAPAMDGNLTRVLSRVHGVREDVGIPSVKLQLKTLGEQDMPPSRCGDFNQALMDLGATVCVPGTPDCDRCPLAPLCDARSAGDADTLPKKAAAKPPKEIAMGVMLVTCRGKILMQQRKERLLEKLWVYALKEDVHSPEEAEKALAAMGIEGKFQKILGKAKHVFTHRVWNMTLYHFEVQEEKTKAGRFVTKKEMEQLPIPTAMKAAKEQARRLLTPFVLRAQSSQLTRAAAAYAESWKASHHLEYSEAFLAEHTPIHMEMLLRAHLSTGRDVYLLWMREEIIGVLVLDRGENELVSLYIAPAFQGLGVGRTAVLFAIGALDESQDIRVTNLCSNPAAQRLYERCGFRHVQTVRLLNPQRNVKEEDRLRRGRYWLAMDALQPTRLPVNREKFQKVRAWIDIDFQEGMEPLDILRIDQQLYLLDGHARAAAAAEAGFEALPVREVPPPENTDEILSLARECQRREVYTPLDLLDYME